jgi:hypothetical protein
MRRKIAKLHGSQIQDNERVKTPNALPACGGNRKASDPNHEGLSHNLISNSQFNRVAGLGNGSREQSRSLLIAIHFSQKRQHQHVGGVIRAGLVQNGLFGVAIHNGLEVNVRSS